MQQKLWPAGLQEREAEAQRRLQEMRSGLLRPAVKQRLWPAGLQERKAGLQERKAGQQKLQQGQMKAG